MCEGQRLRRRSAVTGLIAISGGGGVNGDARTEGVKTGSRLEDVSGVIHFYYHAAPAGGRSGKLFLKQSGGLSSELLPACGRGQSGACRG